MVRYEFSIIARADPVSCGFLVAQNMATPKGGPSVIGRMGRESKAKWKAANGPSDASKKKEADTITMDPDKRL